MNNHQRFALLHPLNTAGGRIDEHRTIKRRPDGALLVAILAVDR